MKLFNKGRCWVIAFLCLVAPLANAAEPTESTKPLYHQVQILQEIQRYVERTDLARLFLVSSTIKTVIANMKSNVVDGRKEITLETMRLLQNLIIQYRFSKVYFGWSEPRSVSSIYVPVIAAQLDELRQLSEDLVREYGFDDSPYTQITANVFRQMQRLLQQLEELPIDSSLKIQLRAQWPMIGETIAIASEGDRPKTFAKATASIRKLRELYPDFNRISTSSAGFDLVMELQGLCEFYAEYAQMD